MKNRNGKPNKGFTLAELLIVVAIIGVVAAVAVPVFTKQQEKSREATDLANARAAYSQLVVAAIEGSTDPALYDDSDPTRPVYKMQISLTQKKDDWQSAESRLYVASLRQGSALWLGRPTAGGSATLELDPISQAFAINWQGGSGNLSFLSASAPYQYEELMTLHESDAEERKAADLATLTAIGNAILNQNLSVNEFKSKYSILTQGAVRVADYYQLKTGSFDDVYSSGGFKLTTTDAFYTDILQGIGYVSGSASSSVTGSPHGIQATTSVYQNSLFFSDELATNQYTDSNGNTYDIGATMRSIIIENIHQSGGKITGFTIYTKAMDGQANMSDEDKAYFRVTVSK